MYTPEDAAATELITKDRPYAGRLYMGFGLVANQGNKRYDKLELFSYTQIFRTKEFDDQDTGDIFGSVSLSYHL